MRRGGEMLLSSIEIHHGSGSSSFSCPSCVLAPRRHHFSLGGSDDEKFLARLVEMSPFCQVRPFDVRREAIVKKEEATKENCCIDWMLHGNSSPAGRLVSLLIISPPGIPSARFLAAPIICSRLMSILFFHLCF